MRRFWIVLVLMLLMVACGGNTANEPAADTGSANTENAAATDAGDEEMAEDESAESELEPAEDEGAEEEAMEDEAAEEEAMEDEATEDEAMEDEGAEDEAATEEAEMEEAAGVDLPMSGTDPETGLEINPDSIPRGVEFIAIGEVIQMNLTPQTSPEFVIRAPNNVTYRIATQALADIFTLDGDTLLPHEYRLNMIARATVFLASDAALSDVLTSDDFIIISLPE